MLSSVNYDSAMTTACLRVGDTPVDDLDALQAKHLHAQLQLLLIGQHFNNLATPHANPPLRVIQSWEISLSCVLPRPTGQASSSMTLSGCHSAWHGSGPSSELCSASCCLFAIRPVAKRGGGSLAHSIYEDQKAPLGQNGTAFLSPLPHLDCSHAQNWPPPNSCPGRLSALHASHSWETQNGLLLSHQSCCGNGHPAILSPPVGVQPAKNRCERLFIHLSMYCDKPRCPSHHPLSQGVEALMSRELGCPSMVRL